MKRYEQSNYDVVGSVMFIILHYRSRESFLKTVEMPYENFMFPVPANYDEVLHFLYGDYMTPKIGTSVHSMAFFDTGRSYKEVLADKSKMKDIKKKLKEQKKE